jgi:hypothetical protein
MPWQSMTAGPIVHAPVLAVWEANVIVPLIVQAPSSIAPAVELKPSTGNTTTASTATKRFTAVSPMSNRCLSPTPGS